MKHLTFDELRAAVPALDELRPIVDGLLSQSTPDDARSWAGSGLLGTVGARMIPESALSEDVAALAVSEAAHLQTIYALVGRALAALAAGDTDGAAKAYLEAAATEEGRDRPGRAAAYAEAAYRAVEGARDRVQAALALRRVARARRTLGDLEQAFDAYCRANELARGMSDHRGAAEAAIGAGNVLEDQGHWEEAAVWYRTALESLGTVDEAAPERWQALINLHIVARSRGALEESRALLAEAEDAAAEIGEAAATVFIENARGQLSMAEGDYGEADRHFRVALDAATQPRARIVVRLNLAETLLAGGRTLDALEQVREAEMAAVHGRVPTKLPEVYRLLGRIAAAEGIPDAFVFFERALELAKERRLPLLEEALTLQAYAEAEADRNEYETARDLWKEARQRFATLGITSERQSWADVFGPTADDDFPAQEQTK